MSRITIILALVMLVGIVVAFTTPPATAAQYTSVRGLDSWSAETNFMSLPGYLRWMTFREQGVWLSMAEANRIVAEQMYGN